MPEFKYRALNSRGETVTGSLSGNDLLAVKEVIKSEGLYPVNISRDRGKIFSSNSSFLKLKREISGQALSQFCRQLSIIITSGVNILNGLKALSEQTPDKLMRSELNRTYREVQKGRTIHEAMDAPGSSIPRLLTSMVATGEASGTLDKVLRSMSDFYEREHRIKQRIQSASVYPAIMALMGVGLIIFFFNFLLPQLVTLITGSGGELPWLTRFVIGISNFTSNYFLLLSCLVLSILLYLNFYLKTDRGRLNKEKVLMKIPVLGRTLRIVATMRFSRTAHILIKSGLPLLQGLEYIKLNVNNALAEQAVDYAIEGLQRGESLAGNLDKANYFDPLAIHMFSIGEETGELEQILEEMASYYEQEADAGFNKLLSLVEPLMLVIIGAIVSIVILSVMLPMMDMVTHVKQMP
ncbi:MAG: type II secretion system F family protein [Clostridiales bacterium]|nr:type II secretion system F family protein [Clostridiales bacterium]MCF8021145.1 type II secretion system F family protein [Clostridiales bacterium]